VWLLDAKIVGFFSKDVCDLSMVQLIIAIALLFINSLPQAGKRDHMHTLAHTTHASLRHVATNKPRMHGNKDTPCLSENCPSSSGAHFRKKNHTKISSARNPAIIMQTEREMLGYLN
jgi:hypothetical protein